ncbi:hypothetical protein L6R29_12840 [Myxococcota bacterium]|nr:hypothetical protein [Myxococcota bacterium]
MWSLFLWFFRRLGRGGVGWAVFGLVAFCGGRSSGVWSAASAQTSQPAVSFAACVEHKQKGRWQRAQRCFCALYRATNDPYQLKNLAKVQALAAFQAAQSKVCPSSALLLRQQAIASYLAYDSFLRRRDPKARSALESEQIITEVQRLRDASRDLPWPLLRSTKAASSRGADVRIERADVRIERADVRIERADVRIERADVRIEGATVRCAARYPAALWQCRSKKTPLADLQTCGYAFVRKESFVKKDRLWLPAGCYRVHLKAADGSAVQRWIRLSLSESQERRQSDWSELFRRAVAVRLPAKRPIRSVVQRPTVPQEASGLKRGLWVASGVTVGVAVVALAGGVLLGGMSQATLQDAKQSAYKETTWRASYEQALQARDIGRALYVVSGGIAAVALGLGIAAIAQKDTVSLTKANTPSISSQVGFHPTPRHRARLP